MRRGGRAYSRIDRGPARTSASPLAISRRIRDLRYSPSPGQSPGPSKTSAIMRKLTPADRASKACSARSVPAMRRCGILSRCKPAHRPQNSRSALSFARKPGPCTNSNSNDTGPSSRVPSTTSRRMTRPARSIRTCSASAPTTTRAANRRMSNGYGCFASSCTARARALRTRASTAADQIGRTAAQARDGSSGKV